MAAVARGLVVLFHDFDGAIDRLVRAFDGELDVLEVCADVERILE